MKPAFRLYIDEVGNSDLESSDDPNHRFLSLTGVVIDLHHVADVVHPGMEALKRKHFGTHPDEPIILHRKEIVNARGPFRALQDQAVKEAFDTELLAALTAWQYTVISVCIDKKAHKERYTTWRYDPYHYCLAALLERFSFFLRRRDVQGDVLAESRGGREDRRLKDSFARLYRDGSSFVGPDQFHEALTSGQLKVKPKANNIAGLQLADLIAHPSRNEILAEQGMLWRPLAPFAQRVIEILQVKYDNVNGKIAGYGKKFL